MSSNFETGHARNVANFETLVSYCRAFGGRYNPAKAALTLPRLENKLADAKFILLNVKSNESDFKNQVNTRVDVFSDLRSLSTRVMASAEASDVSAEMRKDLRTVNRKIHGKRATPIPKLAEDSEVPSARTISSSQRSYDLQVEHLQRMIGLLVAEGTYNPNEADLKISGLQAKADTMMAANTAVIEARSNWSNARIERNKILYDKETGLKAVADEVKSYVRSLFGTTSDEYKQVRGLVIKDPN